MPERLVFFATAARGTEVILARELEALGAKKVRQDRGGVRFSANVREALGICFHTRVAMRVLLPMGEAEAKGAEGLYEATKAIAWEEHLTARSTFAVDATLKDSEHTHSGFVALKVKDAIADRLREKLGSRPDVDPHHPDVHVVAHLAKQQLSLSLDVAGEPLNRRGYRVKQTAAPLKETLAAAILLDAGFTGDEPFADPMCGSGTLAIEAALIAARRPPGLSRHFAAERWPALGPTAKETLLALREEAKASVRPPPHPILARDKDAEALDAAKANARAAQVDRAFVFEESDATFAPPPEGPPGLLATNPPYGDRLGSGSRKGMKSFYFKLGEALAEWHGWKMSFLSGNTDFESAFHTRPKGRRKMFNGPIECELLHYAERP
jgi:23S rRNA (guanine2445-N2)-methyltransferase / 23S rRNA (guanine2069-N7)-methyltransferase